MVAMTFYPGEKGKRKAGGMERRGQGGKKKKGIIALLRW